MTLLVMSASLLSLAEPYYENHPVIHITGYTMCCVTVTVLTIILSHSVFLSVFVCTWLSLHVTVIQLEI